MDLEQRIDHFRLLGEVMGAIGEGRDWPGFDIGLNEEEYQDLVQLVKAQVHHNGWFTEGEVRRALKAWSAELKADKLKKWLSAYELKKSDKKSVGIVMAGNIPMVGFHDLLSTLMAGHKALVKTSKDDDQLVRSFFKVLTHFDGTWKDEVEWVEGPMKGHHAVIATGSNNTSRYFEHYFSGVPHIIRKNRTSVAILDGTETEEEMRGLGEDVFAYYGLGCRNVTKLYVNEDYDLDHFFKAMFDFKEVMTLNKYLNNYDYHRSIYLLNGDDLLENGFLLIKEHESLHSPVACMFYERFSDKEALRKDLEAKADQIQCIVSKEDVPFGRAQYPSLADYADGEDTMAFLSSL